MYSHLSAAAAVERIDEHVRLAEKSRRSAQAVEAAAGKRVPAPRRTARVPLTTASCERHPAGA